MKKTFINIIILLVIISSPIFSLKLDIPNEIPSYVNLIVNLEPSLKEGEIKEARFEFYQAGTNEPLYSEFVKENGKWSATIPYKYLNESELTYFVIMKNEEGELFRYPEIGTNKSVLLKDETPPQLKLIKPTSFNVQKGKEQLIVFEIIDESALANFDIKVDGKSTTKAGAFDQYLSILLNPSEIDERIIYIEMEDRYGNTSSEKFIFKNTKRKDPFFGYDSSFDHSYEIEYLLDLGESENSSNLLNVLKDTYQNLNISYDLNGEIQLNGGPIELELSTNLSDTISITKIFEAYPNTIKADFQNIMQLYNPLDFTNEFNYSGEVARKYYNSNEFLLKISLFDPFLIYKFGDQEIYYQNETINNFELRGSSLEIDLPILEIKLNKGLTNFGLYNEEWPQNFIGMELGIKAKEFWHLQTNLSLISSIQGDYDKLKDSNNSSIGDLYNLDDILPEQNIVVGIESEINSHNLEFNTSLAFSLYNEDASTILDVNQLASDISANSDIDLSPYINYLNQLNSIFPILSYFLPSNGLVAGVINKNLWGISYGATLDLTSLGIETWVRKTDSNYKSLGSSIPTDEFTTGFNLEHSLGEYTARAGYSFNEDNINDILLNEFIPLIKPELKPENSISEYDIANLVHLTKLGVDTPQYNIIGSFSFDYSYLYEKTNANSLLTSADDDETRNSIKFSSNNDCTKTHTGEARWSSKQLVLGPISTSFGASYKNAYITTILVDGVENNNSYNDISYEIINGIDFSKYSLSLSYNHTYSTKIDSTKTYSYNVDFGIDDSFFDSLEFSLSLDQEYSNSLDAYNFINNISCEKKLDELTINATLESNFYNSLINDSEDSISGNLVLKGILN